MQAVCQTNTFSSEMTVYHGSNKIIQHPQYGYGNARNDYGMGFYCTADIDKAREWAAGHSAGDPCYVNKYQLDLAGLNVLNFSDPQYNILHWLTVLLENRRLTKYDLPAAALRAQRYLTTNFHIDTSDVDVIIGYRADDSYFSFAHDFLINALPLECLRKAMSLGLLGEQIVLISPKAFSVIAFRGYEVVPHYKYVRLYMLRDDKARQEYRDMDVPTGTYIQQIMNENWRPDDERLF